jgi:TATA-box binding protein (TBP) (component of TFIID and TFIIIB)
MGEHLNLTAYADLYFSFMEKAKANGHFVNVSTITLICVLNIDNVDLKHFVNEFKHENVHIKVPPVKTGTTKMKKTFYNQITLNYRDISNKSIKLFSNGKLQITGLTSFFECDIVLKKITGWLNDVFKTTNIAVTNAYVGMLNINFSVQNTIDLQGLNRVLNSFDNVMAVYNPETYPAINVKLQKSDEFTFASKGNSVSLFVFGTGNIVVTGTKSLEQAMFAYDFIIDVFAKSKEVFKLRKERKMDDMSNYIEGYAARQFLSCIGD